MNDWLGRLREQLQRLETDGLLRHLQVVEPLGRQVVRGGRPLINLAGNDYLGLSQHPRIKSAAIEAIGLYGTGAGASRLVSGHQPIHAQLEARFARFKHAQAAIILPTGYMANLAVISTLAAAGDLICVDKTNHASLLDAARASGAMVRAYPHGQMAKLDRLLARHTRNHPTGQRLIVTDSVFSMDGDTADLPTLCDLADRYDAILVVDEAHGTGVLGPSGAGLCELQGVEDRVDVVVSTASKALGGLGGIVTAGREVIDTLINRARCLIYTTAIPPAQAAAIGAALDIVHDEPQRRERLLKLSSRLRTAIHAMGLAQPRLQGIVTPIIPVIAGSVRAASDLAQHLEAQGLFAPAIRPPTVPPNTARVRVSLRADLEDGDIDRLIQSLEQWPGRRDSRR